MAKLSEVLLKSGVVEDEKARRVSNASRKTASITADEIENGVSIERLESIGVPVFKYTTQLTIHGKLPAFSESARPGGYKSIVRNGNGSVGVRYVAIDASKKNTILEASKAQTGQQWHASINSEGLTVSAHFQEKADCIAAYHAFPRDLFVGSIMAGAGAYGGYYVIVSVGAVYSKDLWAFIKALWSIESIDQLSRITAERDARWEREREESRKQLEAARQSADAKAKELASKIELPKLSAVPQSGCFVRVGSLGAFRYFVKRKGPALCYVSHHWAPGQPAIESYTGKMKRLDAVKLASLQKSAEAGMLFSLS